MPDIVAELSDLLKWFDEPHEVMLTIEAARNEIEELRLWRETVRDIYDECHFGPHNTFTGYRLAQQLIDMIERRHPEFFGAAATKETP